jgi:glycosyltransferase involved in cell wall biosynthesis
MKLSYLVTFSTETETLERLLNMITINKCNNDEIVLLADSGNLNIKTGEILKKFLSRGVSNVFYWEHNLNKDYSSHKNYGATKCNGDYIFQIDGDECPTETLLVNVKDIIEANPDIEAFWIARINDFRGVTSEHAKQWGWRLSESPTYKRPLVNWPDPQCRIFKNKSEIKWVSRLHERIEGNKNFVYLPFDEDLALYHNKTIEKQIETNLRYNQNFTAKENQGFNLPK